LKEGKSWFRENREMKFGFYFTEEKGYKYYSIMVPGKEGEVSIPKKGEPKAYTTPSYGWRDRTSLYGRRVQES